MYLDCTTAFLVGDVALEITPGKDYKLSRVPCILVLLIYNIFRLCILIDFFFSLVMLRIITKMKTLTLGISAALIWVWFFFFIPG